jgi:hypothetical protein
VEAERQPTAAAHELPGRALLPEATGGILLVPAAARRPVVGPIELVVGARVLGDPRVRPRFPQPFDVVAAQADGRDVIGRPVEQAERPVRRRLVARLG